MKKRIMLLISLVLVFVLCACGSKATGIEGTYDLYAMEDGGMAILAEDLIKEGIMEKGTALVLNEGGKGVLKIDGDNDLKWTYDGAEKITITAGADKLDAAYKSGVVTMDMEGSKMYFASSGADTSWIGAKTLAEAFGLDDWFTDDEEEEPIEEPMETEAVTEAAKQAPATSGPTISYSGTDYDCEKFTMTCPDGWANVVQHDIFADDENAVYDNKLAFYKGYEDEWDALYCASVIVSWDEPGLYLMDMRDLYDDVEDATVVVNGREWKGFTGYSGDYKNFWLACETDTSVWQASGLMNGEKSEIALDDPDFLGILASTRLPGQEPEGGTAVAAATDEPEAEEDDDWMSDKPAIAGNNIGRYNLIKYEGNGSVYEGEILKTTGMDKSYIDMNSDGTGFFTLMGAGFEITWNDDGDIMVSNIPMYTYKRIDDDTIEVDMQGVILTLKK